MPRRKALESILISRAAAAAAAPLDTLGAARLPATDEPSVRQTSLEKTAR